MSRRQNRADHVLIAIALIILLMAGSAFYFDNWMWGQRRDRGSKIGAISTKSGDVRVKFEGDLKWGKAARGQELVYNDSIYAGEGSQADLALGNSKMSVQQNTLIVLRREKNVNFLNLNYGTMFGQVAKDEKIMIDTGSGKPIEFTPTSRAQIVLSKNKGKTELKVISGEADMVINGERRRLNNTSKVILDEKAPTPTPKIEPARLIAISPLKDQVIYSDVKTEIPFRWEMSGQRPSRPSEFTLEFSGDPTFEKIQTRKAVGTMTNTSMGVSKTLSLFYRVRNSTGQLSQVEKVNFVRMEKPLIVKPIADQVFVTPAGQNAMIEFEFNGSSKNGFWYQVAHDPDFNQILIDKSIRENRSVDELSLGSFFVRARGNYGDNHLGPWSTPQAFRVDAKLEPLRLTEVPDQKRAIIPNRDYPKSLYKARASVVQDYLAKNGFLKNFFPFKANEFDRLQIAFEGDASAITQNNSDWPASKIAPSNHIYKYQVSKTGFEDSAISNPKQLNISMEAPRAIGPAKLADPLEDGSREVSMSYTPLLFAKSYDVEIGPDAGFSQSIPLKSESSVARKTLPPGEYYWRVRARDARDRVISEFSAPARVKVPVLPPVPRLAEELAPPTSDELQIAEERSPAAVASTSTAQLEKSKVENWVNSGWWAWLGSGMNYVDYRQSVQNRGTLTSHSPKFPSQYIEVGYNGRRGWGGEVSYKRTPGEITVENAAIDNSNYIWSTMSVEGFLKTLSHLPFTDTPVTYGMKVGLQEHRTPFVFLTSQNTLQLKENKMQAASFGMLAQLQKRRWTHSGLVRYQFPFSSKSSGADQFELKPTFAFDGSLGTSYSITPQFKAGLFWYGQWHQYNFVYGSGATTNTGFQSLFYSNIDLRLGFEF